MTSKYAEKSLLRPELKEEAFTLVNSALIDEGWSKGRCKECGTIFYSQEQSDACGNQKCSGATVIFPRENNMAILSLHDMLAQSSNFFKAMGYRLEKPRHILHSNKSHGMEKLDKSLFTISGVQILDDLLFGESNIEEGRYKKIFVEQPSVRLNHVEDVGVHYGRYTSFTNICTESINPSPREYVEDLTNWIEFFKSTTGLNNLRLTLAENESNWNGKRAMSLQTFFYYKNLELGDANFYYNFPQDTRDAITLGDIGFGAERICCCINKPARDFDIIGPYMESLNHNYQLIDKTRTLTLLVGSNILPSDSAAGSKVRGLIRELSSADRNSFKWFTLVPYYYAFWSGLTELELSPVKIREVIRNEINRQANTEVANLLKLDISDDVAILPMYEFIDNCLLGKYGRKISLDRIDEICDFLKNEKRSG
jgi:hypothetical protein